MNIFMDKYDMKIKLRTHVYTPFNQGGELQWFNSNIIKSMEKMSMVKPDTHRFCLLKSLNDQFGSLFFHW